MNKLSLSEKETIKIAMNFAQSLKGGDVLALTGDLGAGKTIFAKGIAAAFGVKETVNSPTFVIMKNYKASRGLVKELVHIDAYRLENENDIKAIGALDYFGRSGAVVLVEWPERVKDILPKKTKWVKISYLKNKREIIL